MQKVIFLGCGYGEIELIVKNYKNNSDFILFSPLCAELNLSANYNLISYEIGAELGVLALLAGKFLAKNEIFKDFINSLDIGYLASECNVGEEEIDEIFSADSPQITDFYKRDKIQNLDFVSHEEEALHRLSVRSGSEGLKSCSGEATGAATAFAQGDTKSNDKIVFENITLIIGSDLENHPKIAEIAAILAALNQIIKIEFQKAPKLQEIFSNFAKTDSIESLKKALNSEILLDESNGFFARICKTSTSYFLAQAQKEQKQAFLIAPNQFLKAQKIPQETEFVEISFLDKKQDSMLGKIKAKIEQNKMLKGIIAELALPQIPSGAEFFAYSQIQLKAIN